MKEYIEQIIRPAFEQYIRESYAKYDWSVGSGDVDSMLSRKNDRGYEYDNMPVHFKWIGFRDAYLREWAITKGEKV